MPGGNAVPGREWYTPLASDFRPEYESDVVNKSRQTWDQYWSWVKVYYAGNLLHDGWTNQAKETLQAIRSETLRDSLQADLNGLGRRLAAEWAKDNSCRKIDTAALRSFGLRLKQAQKKDDGSGEMVRETVQALRTEIEAKLVDPR
jgi:hypothetical protein